MSNEFVEKIPLRGDKEKFDRFFKRFYPRLTAYACLFVDDVAAEDIVQDFFVYLWENSEFIDIHTSLEAYLFKSIYLRCLNLIKQRNTHKNHHKQIEEYLLKFEKQLFDPDANESIRRLFMDELGAEINAAIDSLPEKCRQVFLLSYIHDLKNKEIAEILGISNKTVENHIHNALKVLRVKLSKHAKILALLFPF